MTIRVTQITGDVVELVFSPREEDLRVGEILSIGDRHHSRGLIVQILEIHTGPELSLPQETSRPRRESRSLPFSPRRRSPKTAAPPASTHPNQHLALAKIRNLTTPDWQAWDGWIPMRDAVVTPISDREVLHHCLPQGGNPFPLGQTLAGERFAIDAQACTGVNIITGAQTTEACQLAAVILRGLVAQGRPCVVFDVSRAAVFSADLSIPDQGAQSLAANIVWLRAGSALKLDVRQCGPAALLTLLTQFGLPKLPALYFVNQVAHRLAKTVSAEEVSQTPPFLGVEDLLQLAEDLETHGNKAMLGAILSSLRLIQQEGVLARTAAETTAFQVHYETIRRGGGIIVDLSGLGNAARGGVVRAIVDLLVGLQVVEKSEGLPHSPCLILEEPQLYLRHEDLQEILTRATSLEMTSLIVTVHLSGIAPALLRRADNLFLLRHGCPDDMRTLTNSGLLDHDTVSALSCRLGNRHGLLVGKATGQFPVLFAIATADDQTDVSLESAARRERSELPPSTSDPARLSRFQPRTVESSPEATLPLFPEEVFSQPAASQPVPPGEREYATPAGASEVSLAQITAKWDQVIKRVGRRRRILETILSTARPVHLDRHTLLLGFPPQSRFQQELMASPEYRSLLEEELSSLFGVPFEVTATFHPLPETPRR